MTPALSLPPSILRNTIAIFAAAPTPLPQRLLDTTDGLISITIRAWRLPLPQALLH